MKPAKMDFSKFQHVRSDAHSTTLRHPDGHEILLAHGALSKEHQAQLGALKGIATDAQTPMQTDQAKHLAAAPQSRPNTGNGAITAINGAASKNGKVTMKLAQGGEVDQRTSSPEDSKCVTRPSAGWGAVTVCDATGGEVHVSDRRHVKFCLGCGGPVKLADGGDVAQEEKAFDENSKQEPAAPTVDMNSVNDPFHMGEATKLDSTPTPQGPSATQPTPDSDNSGWGSSEGAGVLNAVKGLPTMGGAPDIAPTNTPPASPDGQPATVQASQEPGVQDAASQDQTPAGAPDKSAPPMPASTTPAQKTVDDHYHEQRQSLQKEDDNLTKALANQTIKPETLQSLFAKKDTLGKIGTLFGLLVGGFGAGLTHTENPVLKAMQDTITNDLDAQKTSASNAQNLVRLTHEHELQKAQAGLMGQQGKAALAQARGANAEADARVDSLAQVRANRIALQTIVDQTKKYPEGSPQRQQAENQLAMLSSQVNSENYNLLNRAAASGALMSYAGGSNGQTPDAEQAFASKNRVLRLSGHEKLAEDLEAKHIPGVGDANIAVPEQTKQGIVNIKNMNDLMNRSLELSKKYSGVSWSQLDPSVKAEAASIHGQLIGVVKQVQHDGVYKPSEATFIGDQVGGDPSALWANFSSVPKIQTIQKIKTDEYKRILESVGIHNSAALPQSSGPEKAETKTIGGRLMKKITVNGQTGYVPAK